MGRICKHPTASSLLQYAESLPPLSTKIIADINGLISNIYAGEDSIESVSAIITTSSSITTSVTNIGDSTGNSALSHDVVIPNDNIINNNFICLYFMSIFFRAFIQISFEGAIFTVLIVLTGGCWEL